MSWCLADVIKMHGESGLRGRHAEWTDAETTVIYPDMTPEMIQSLRARPTEEIGTPQPTPAPPQDPLRLAPPSSPPSESTGRFDADATSSRGATACGSAADVTAGQPQSGTRSPGIRPVAAPVVNGPTITPQQAGAAPRPVNQPAMQPAQSAAYYSHQAGPGACEWNATACSGNASTGAVSVASEVRGFQVGL